MGQVSQTLDTEHRHALDLLGRMEVALSRREVPRDSQFAALASAFVRLLEHDTGAHFDFEESELFVRMAEAGESDIAEADFDRFKRGVLEIVERQVAHIQKETMALLPLLDDLLDDDTDRELSMLYASA